MYRNRPARILGAIAAALAVAAFPAFEITPAAAAVNVSTWTGATSGQWSVGTNWQSGVVPAPGDQLVFPAGASNKSSTNDLSGSTTYDSLVLPDTAYVLGGNNIHLTNGITSVGTNQISADVILEGDQTFTNNGVTFLNLTGHVDVNGHTLTLANPGLESIQLLGGVSGTGAIVADNTMSASTVTLAGSSSFTGPISLSYGNLSLMGGSAPGTDVQLSGAAEILGFGTVGSITTTTTTSQIIVGSPAGTIQAVNDLTMTPVSTFTESLHPLACASPSSYGTLEVGGDVHIAGARLNIAGGGGSLPGQVCTLIQNDGSNPVDGTFANLPEGAFISAHNGGSDDIFQISYVGGDGNDVTLSAVGGPAFAGAGTVRLDQASYEMDQGGGYLPIHVLRLGGGSGAIGYTFQTNDGTAVGGTYPAGDFTPISSADGLGDGMTDTYFDLFANATTPFFGDRTLTISLTGPSGGATLGTPATATVTIHGSALLAPPPTTTTTSAPTTTTTAGPATTSTTAPHSSTSTSTTVAMVDPISGTLPRTGGSSRSVALIGLAALMVGATLAAIRRPRRSYS